MTAQNTGFKGLNCRQTGLALLFDALLQSSAGALVTGGTTNLYIWEVQSDGTIKTYDFSSNTFKSTAVTTETQAMNYQKSNNAGTDTGYWTYALSTLTGFTVGANYRARVNNTGASPTDTVRAFVFGSAEGDLAVTAGATGVAYLQVDKQLAKGNAITTTTNGMEDVNAANIGNHAAALDSNNLLKVALTDIINTALSESSGGNLSAAFKKLLDVATPVLTAASVNLSGDAYAQLNTLIAHALTFDSNNLPKVSLASILNTLLTETTGGNLAGAFKKFFDIAVPVLTTACVNSTGDPYGYLTANLGLLGAAATALASAAGLSALQTAVNNLNNLSALANIFGPGQVEIPASGSIAYPMTMTVKDAEGHLLDLSTSPTLTAANGAGTDRSGNLSGITHASTGVYTFTYTVASAAAQEGITIKGSGTASSDSTSRIAFWSFSVVSDDTTATLAAIEAQTNKIGTTSGDSTAAQTAQAAITEIAADTDTLITAANALATTIGAAGAGLTNLGDGRLAHLDVNVSTRSAPTTAQTIDLAPGVPHSNTPDSIGDCLHAARVQGFGKWVFDPVALTLKLYESDNTTVAKMFSVDSATAPTQRA